MQRIGEVSRKTNETNIKIKIIINGNKERNIKTGVPFMDHMLDLFAAHGQFGLVIDASGDTIVDAHHTVEDIGICLGQALDTALKDKKGITRYGYSAIPMDEAMVTAVVDISNRPYLVFNVDLPSERIGKFDTELVPEFFRALVHHSGITLHLNLQYGANTHHIIEACFKAFARALKQAAAIDEKNTEIPSTKGML